jgi:hypothetical protein
MPSPSRVAHHPIANPSADWQDEGEYAIEKDEAHRVLIPPQVSQTMNAFLFEFVKKKRMTGVFEAIIRFGAKKRISVK